MRKILIYALSFCFCLFSSVADCCAVEAGDQTAEVIQRWLSCEDCDDAALADVVGLGDQAVPLLALCATEGPTPARREALRLHLTGLFLVVKAESLATPREGGGSAGHPAQAEGQDRHEADPLEGMTLRATVDRYLASAADLERVRAVQALAAIGSEDARKALRQIGSQVAAGRLGPVVARHWAGLMGPGPPGDARGSAPPAADPLWQK